MPPTTVTSTTTTAAAPTTTVPRPTTTTHPRSTIITAAARPQVVLSIPAEPRSDPMVTVAVGDDLEIHLPAGQLPDASDIGDANPAILRRDPIG